MALVALLVFAASAQAQAVIKFEKSVANFGKFEEEKVQSASFVFTNVGTEPLVLQQVITSCGCTAADYTKTPIAPGKTGQVNITYNGRGKYPGHFKRPITIRSNASNSIVRIYIEGIMKKRGENEEK